MTTILKDTPKIYVACLAAYNEAILHGAWIDASLGLEHVQEEVKKIIDSSPAESAEEWAIHDYEGFHGIKVDEWDSFETVCEIAEALNEYDDEKADLFGELYQAYDLEQSKDRLENNYYGCFESYGDFAAEFLDNTGDLSGVPDFVRNYFDFEQYGSDLVSEGGFDCIQLGSRSLHIFSNP
jgi:antirestriction protein